MAITEAFVDTGATIGTTEYSLPNDSTSLTARTEDGVYQAFIDCEAVTTADEFRIRVYEKVFAAGSARIIYYAAITNPQTVVLPSLILLHGWDITVQKITGTDRSISWSIRQVA